MRYIVIIFIVLLFSGCEDVNTFCSKDINTSVPDDSNTSDPDDSNTSNPDDSNNSVDVYTYSKDMGDEDMDLLDKNDENMDRLDENDEDFIDEDIDNEDSNTSKGYALHKKIKSDLFWIGENNKYIDRSESAWDSQWKAHYGGEDTPDKRDEYYPDGFAPDENPFYAALPYNDLDKSNKRKKGASRYIPWATDADDPKQSICKNRWIRITAHRKNVYAQWEDVGPNGDNDIEYVFGKSSPAASNALGIYVSPAVRDYLSLDENDTVEWKFVDREDVPGGPWRDIITSSNSNQSN